MTPQELDELRAKMRALWETDRRLWYATLPYACCKIFGKASAWGTNPMSCGSEG